MLINLNHFGSPIRQQSFAYSSSNHSLAAAKAVCASFDSPLSQGGQVHGVNTNSEYEIPNIAEQSFVAARARLPASYWNSIVPLPIRASGSKANYADSTVTSVE